MRGVSRTGWLVALLVTQILIMAALLGWSATVHDQIRMPLEARLPEPRPGIHLPARDLLEKVNILSGPEYLGIELLTPFRRSLSFQEGQMFWIFLQRRLSMGTPLVERAREAVREAEVAKRIQDGLCDGFLSFLYDVGGHRDVARQNWAATAVGELQASPLLPWAKKLDFVALSSLAETSVGGLRFVTDLNPEVLLILPEHDPVRFRGLRLFHQQPHAVVLPVGVHALAPGLWAQVLVAPVGTGHPAELNLLVEGGDGRIVLISGSSLNRPLVSLRQAKQSLGRRISTYVGSTGYVTAVDTSDLQDEIQAIHHEFPDLILIPNGDTSLLAHCALEALLGPSYRPGRLGARVDL
ncbi:MAG: hypothetical protein ACOX9B_02630 [Candidatus Xenobium sp.]|jgi:hypothetical protein|nr:hypothetical protein [Burkholderiales bacterium]